MSIMFCITTTGQTFRVKATADCPTRNVVYFIECKKYPVQYSEETEKTPLIRY